MSAITGSRGGLIAFVHIPKTAGTTINTIIRHLYPTKQLYKFHPAPESIQRFHALPRHRREALRLVYGHIDFSWQEILPPDTRFFVFLRNPVERAISHYYHLRRAVADPLHQRAKTSSLLQWVSTCGILEMDNGQTRRLAGEMDLPYGEVSSLTLERAKANLANNFAVVGLTERFEESQILLSHEFGWPLNRYNAHNVADNRPHRNEVTPEILRAVEYSNRFDMELYLQASKHFERAVGNIDMAHELGRLSVAPQYVRPQPSVPFYHHALSGLKSLFPSKRLSALLASLGCGWWAALLDASDTLFPRL